MAKITASERLRRVLAIVPWIVSNPNHTVEHIANRFDLSEKELLQDLSVVYMVGLPPYSPDALIDVQIDDAQRVKIELAEYFSRPLKLSPDQGFSLLASAQASASLPGHLDDKALRSGIEKLARSLGVDEREMIRINLGEAESETIDKLGLAVAEKKQIEIVYFSFGKDEVTERRVSPWRLFAKAGAWYLLGWCDTADAERVFRVDRIEAIKILDSPAQQPAHEIGDEAMEPYSANEDDPRVVLEVAHTHAWLLETYPHESVVDLDSGNFQVTMAISEQVWLERLLVTCGAAVKIVSAENLPEASLLASTAAARVLERYSPIS